MSFDYYEEAIRIWELEDGEFDLEYTAIRKWLKGGPHAPNKYVKNIQAIFHHQLPKYYIKLSDILCDMVFSQSFIEKNVFSLNVKFEMWVKLHSYVSILSKMKNPVELQFFKLDFIQETIDLLKKKD